MAAFFYIPAMLAFFGIGSFIAWIVDWIADFFLW